MKENDREKRKLATKACLLESLMVLQMISEEELISKCFSSLVLPVFSHTHRSSLQNEAVFVSVFSHFSAWPVRVIIYTICGGRALR